MKNDNIKDIVENKLCIGCGLCEVICPYKAISMVYSNETGNFYPTVDENICTKCSLCLEVCYGAMRDPKLSFKIFGNSVPFDPIIGHYLGLYIGYATDKRVRFNAAAGGVATALLAYALEKKIIDGAIVVRMRPGKLPMGECFIAYTLEDLFSAAGSKYCPVNFSKCFKKLETGKRYAIVTLPCYAYGIRKLIEINPMLRSKIVLIIGLLCGGMPSYLGTIYLLKTYGLEGYFIRRLEYRGGGWPGRLLIEGRQAGQQKLVTMPYPDYWRGLFNYFQPFRCTICNDGFNSFADISVGDAWHPEIIKSDKEGTSLIITRSKLGEHLIKEAFKAGKIDIHPIPKKDVLTSQRNLIKYKYCSILARILISEFIFTRKKVPYSFERNILCTVRFSDLLSAIDLYVGNILASRKRFLRLFNYYIFLKEYLSYIMK